MKLRAYDKYGKQHLIIDLGNDEVYTSSTSSQRSTISANLTVRLDEDWYNAHPDEYGEDPEFKRWSDLVDVEIVEQPNE